MVAQFLYARAGAVAFAGDELVFRVPAQAQVLAGGRAQARNHQQAKRDEGEEAAAHGEKLC